MSSYDRVMNDELLAAVQAKASEARRRERQFKLAAEDAADEARAADQELAALTELQDEHADFNGAARRFFEA